MLTAPAAYPYTSRKFCPLKKFWRSYFVRIAHSSFTPGAKFLFPAGGP